jgi:hypothetical protein
VTAQQVGQFFTLMDKVFFTACFMSDSFIRGGECQLDLLNSQSLVYNDDRKAPPGSSKTFQRFNRWQIQTDG